MGIPTGGKILHSHSHTHDNPEIYSSSFGEMIYNWGISPSSKKDLDPNPDPDPDPNLQKDLRFDHDPLKDPFNNSHRTITFSAAPGRRCFMALFR